MEVIAFGKTSIGSITSPNSSMFVVINDSFQRAWLTASRMILEENGELWNLTVHIGGIQNFDVDIHSAYNDFCDNNGLLRAKHVAYTIFPESLSRNRTAVELYHTYNRENGAYDRVKKGWGTYFRRMTAYKTASGRINQIDNIINAISNRTKKHKAAYTVITQKPGTETTRTRGGPCLNYLALQVGITDRDNIGLLAVYRNHDFLEKAYGNYLGLTQLLAFICRETGFSTGPLTCVSSHAYIAKKKPAISDFIEGFGYD